MPSHPPVPQVNVDHEPIVSETLKRGAEQNQEAAERSQDNTQEIRSLREEMKSGETTGQEAQGTTGTDTAADPGPAKQHGDALLDGSGNRHGVHDAEERPNTCA